MNIQEVINRYLGKSLGYPNQNSYLGECLSSVKWYIKNYFGINPPASGVNGAYGYWTNFPAPLGQVFNKVVNSPTNMPKPGDIMIWNTKVGGGAGHIAVVIDANVNSFRSLDQNWGSRTIKIITHNYTNVYGWLTPKEAQVAKTWYELDIEAKFAEIASLKSWGADLQDKLNKITVSDYEKGIKINDLNVALAKSNETIKNLEGMIKDLQKQIGDIKPVNEKEVVEGFIGKVWKSITDWAKSTWYDLFKKK